MNEGHISVRQWQEQFRAGAYESKDLKVQCAAGWYDWFCRDEALAGRLKKISRVVMGITDPYILDNYYVWFKNNCPVVGDLYDDVRFEPLSGDRDGKYFVVSLDSPYESRRWTLFTERYDFGAPEYECENVRDMVKYINSMAHELEQGIIPAFVAERAGGHPIYAAARQGGQSFDTQERRAPLFLHNLSRQTDQKHHCGL